MPTTRYYSVPGHQHIQLLAPERGTPTPKPAPPVLEPDTALSATPQTNQRVDPLVRQAISAAFGGYDPTVMTASRFSTSVRTHIRAYRRAQLQLRAHTRNTAVLPTQHVRVITCHSGEAGEFYGTVEKGGRRLAFAAKMADGKLQSFKILEPPARNTSQTAPQALTRTLPSV